MKVEILCVGTEILLGNIVNTNSAYLSKRCADLGLTMFYQGVVGDNEIRLEEAIKEALERSDVLILSGGLGPTNDDVTKEITAKAEEETLADVVVKKAKEKNITITTAESLTGGILAGKIVDVSGASECFGYGFVTYSNEAKHKEIGVKEETLNTCGAVSFECAKEMAKGAAIKANADIAVATTGIAGPTSDEKNTPVGRVYIGVYSKGNAKAFEFNFKGTRQIIRERSVVNALNILRKEIENY